MIRLMDQAIYAPSENFSLCFVFLILVVLGIIAVIGVYMGVNEKITIYNGKEDFALTLCGAALPILGIFFYSCDNSAAFYADMLVTSAILILSFRESRIANATITQAIFSMAGKYILVGFLAGCGIFALGGLSAGVDDLKKKILSGSFASFAIAAVAILAAKLCKGLIDKLIIDRVCPRRCNSRRDKDLRHKKMWDGVSPN